MSGSNRRVVPILVVTLGVAAAVLVASWLTGGAMGLRLSHAIQMQLGGEGVAAEVDVPPAGRIKLFLHRHDTVITPTILSTGLWEPTESYWFTKMVGEGDVVVDVGANVGWYTLLAARLVGESGHVYAFEPAPDTFALLEQNVRVNGFQNVTVVQKAASNENGSLRFYLQENNRGGNSVWQSMTAKTAIDVEAVTLDSYFADHAGRIDFVKIDTQGAEGAILNGMTEIIRTNKDLILTIEFWPFGLKGFGYRAEDLLSLLSGSGFRFFDLGPGVGGVQERLREQTVRRLLRLYPQDKGNFTNLLAIRDTSRVR